MKKPVSWRSKCFILFRFFTLVEELTTYYMNMTEITSVNERAPALPKLFDYYVKNSDEFKAKFKNSRKDHRPLHLENSSLFFKFNECILFEHPYNVYKTRKYLFISI